MIPNTLVRLFALALPAIVLASCSFAPRMTVPASKAELPDAFDARTSADTLSARAAWWSTFNDPTLDALVDSALVRNLDIRAAVARVTELQNQYRIARGPLMPAIQGSVDGTQSSVPSNTGSFGSIGNTIPGFPDRFENVTYSASLGFSYELDFWGRNRNAAGAALNDYFATRADAETARMGIVSETIATYYEIADLEDRITLSAGIVDLLDERTQLSESRYAGGLISSFELYAVRQNFDNEKAGYPTLEASLYEARGRLAILLGAYQAEAERWLGTERGANIPLAPIPAGLPATLLEARPDVYAAGLRLESARQRIGVARAAQLPSLSLTGAGGTQSSELRDLVDIGPQNFWNLAGALTTPVFNGGRLRADVKVAYARYDQQLAAYEKTVLTAFKEVNATLVGYEREQERLQALREALASAEASAQTQRERYERGIGDYLGYLDAQINLMRLRSTFSAARRALVLARLNVHRALGGGWFEFIE